MIGKIVGEVRCGMVCEAGVCGGAAWWSLFVSTAGSSFAIRRARLLCPNLAIPTITIPLSCSIRYFYLTTLIRDSFSLAIIITLI